MTVGRLTDAAVARRDARVRPTCSVATLLASLGDDDRADLVALLADTSLNNAVIEDVTHDLLGATVKAQTFGRHRRGRCCCGPAD